METINYQPSNEATFSEWATVFGNQEDEIWVRIYRNLTSIEVEGDAMGCRLTKLPVVSGLPVVAEGWRDPAKGLLLTQVRFCDVASAAYKQYKGRIIELKL